MRGGKTNYRVGVEPVLGMGKGSRGQEQVLISFANQHDTKVHTL